MIMEVPETKPCTKPAASIVATLVLLLDQVPPVREL